MFDAAATRTSCRVAAVAFAIFLAGTAQAGASPSARGTPSAGGTTTTAARTSTTGPTTTTTAPPVGVQQIDNLDYGGDGLPRHGVTAYLPQDGKTNRPAVILVHGGGWTSANRNAVADDAIEVAQAGFVAFSIDYGVDESPRWPDEMNDVQLAVRWAQDNAATYGLDPTSIGLFGNSAGGNLTMLVGVNGIGEGRPAVKAVASWSGPSDLTTIAITNLPGDTLAAPPTIPLPGAETPPGCVGNPLCLGMVAPAFVQVYMECTLSECPEQYRDASPVFWVTSSTPPMFLAGSETELVPFEQNLEMANALMDVRVASTVLLMAGSEHAEGFRTTAMQPTIDFFRQYLVAGADPRTAANAPPSLATGSLPLPPLGPNGRFTVPDPPPAAAPRTGVIGYIQRNIRWFVRGGIALGVAVITVVVIRRHRKSRPRPASTAPGSPEPRPRRH